jgi:hypothetical protein
LRVAVPGDVIAGRYRLDGMVGSGAMGLVWEAWDLRLERRVALKQLRPLAGLSGADQALAYERAMREARITARLHHRYAVPVFDVVEHAGQPCLVMQFIPSVPLAAILRESGPLLPPEAAKLGAQVGSALAAAHEVGIVHRDVKPGNILVAEDGSALISDFGISRALGDATLTGTGLVHGTPAFLAPEVARGGDASYASDVFSLGATLYAALEGTPPFGTDPNSIVLLHRVASGRFDPPRHSGELTTLLVSMLSSSPADRPTMSAVARALATFGSRDAPMQRAAGSAAASAPSIDQTHARTGLTEPEPMPTRVPAPTVVTPQGVGDDPSTEVAAPGVERAPARRRIGGAVILAAAAVALVVVAVLVLGDLGGTNARVGAPGTTASVSAVPSPLASAPPTAKSSPTEPRTSTVSAPPSLTETPPAQSTSAPASPNVSGPELAGAIRAYYALLPAHTDKAWPGMTTAYQASHAGGRSSYDAFWRAIRRVSATNVTGTAPDRAEATISYEFRDGRRVRERTSYQLVQVGGTLKINDSTVLSSN